MVRRLPLRRVVHFLGLIVFAISMNSFAEQAPDSVKSIVPQLQSWGSDPQLVAAVKAQNAENLSLDTIKDRDEKWRKSSDISALMKALMTNNAAKRLIELEKSKPYLVELFLMDNQGANVAMSNRTSDYWQGDEEKFTQSYQQGQGHVYVSKVEYDESTQAYLVQVSVPVIDQGKAIGALTIGINLDNLEGM
ncbi:PDC sensor domain-containing protein [Celerinatantimonas yamalensis]|uniref:Cache domain-containing protein n=1 Tax=Celerinatantimonas yamalensis TaxID=559956 RepID=A0ABW9G2S6_9GAMM